MGSVSDWARYGELVDKVAAEGDGFWRNLRGYDDFVRAVAERDPTWWGGAGSSLEGRGLDALVAELDESDDNTRLTRLRNAFTARPTSSYPRYRDTVSDPFVRFDEAGTALSAPTRDATTWSPVGAGSGQASTASSATPRYYNEELTRVYDGRGWVDVASLPAGEWEPRLGDRCRTGAGRGGEPWRDVTELDIGRFRPAGVRDETAGDHAQANGDPRYFNQNLTRTYDRTLGWVPVAELPADEREPRIGDFYSDQATGGWLDVTQADIDRVLAGAPATDEAAKAPPARYYDVSLHRVWDEASGQYVRASSAPVPGTDRRYLANGTSEVITEGMLAAAGRGGADVDRQTRDALRRALQSAPVVVDSAWADYWKYTDELDQQRFAVLLDGIGLPGSTGLKAIKDEWTGEPGRFEVNYLNDDLVRLRYSVELGLSARGEARVGLRFAAELKGAFVRRANRTAVDNIRQGTTMTYHRLGETVLIDDTTNPRMPTVLTMLELFAQLTDARVETGTIRRTTHRGRAAIKITGDLAAANSALKAAGWTGLTSEDTSAG